MLILFKKNTINLFWEKKMKNRKTVLLIDDEKEIRDLLKNFFEKKKIEIIAVEDGSSALEFMKDEIPDLVITDLLLRGEHGLDIIKTIKKKYFIPLIIISGIYKKEEMAGFIEENFVEGFFEKPLDLFEIEKKINSTLNV